MKMFEADDNLCKGMRIAVNMKILLYSLFALVLAAPFAKPADAQVVVAVGGHHHHRHYRHHHHHPYR